MMSLKISKSSKKCWGHEMRAVQKKIQLKSINIPFQSRVFFTYFAAGFLLCALGVVLLLYVRVPLIQPWGYILILLAYSLPTWIGFDLMQSYEDDFYIPKVDHPHKYMVLMINLFLGWTILGWVAALLIACWPGAIAAEIVTYSELEAGGFKGE